MEATELRIKNYVYRQSGKMIVNRDSIYQVENVNIQSARKYDPIPLSEKWLLDFGYKKAIAYFIAKGHLIWKCNDLFMCDKNGIIIKYVHQLQNLYFASTQTELIKKP